jgi:Co/Zn/Cd efflux system component
MSRDRGVEGNMDWLTSMTFPSASLQADALDFLGDAANYAISLFVVGMALRYRATAAMIKGLTMGAFGGWRG